MHKIFVDKDYRNLNVGTLLFKKTIKEMDSLKQDSFLTVCPKNTGAMKLYENIGYEFDRLVKGYYRESEDRIVMVRKFKK